MEGLKSSSGAEVAARETALADATAAAAAAADDLATLKAEVAEKEEAATAAAAAAAAELATLQEEAGKKEAAASAAMVGRCRLTVSKPMLKAPIVSALERRIS